MQEKEQQARRSRDVEALAQALNQEGCPICLTTLEAMQRVMDTWQYEGFSDIENRQGFLAARGFCPRHTWQLCELSTAFQLALVYREIFPDLLANIQGQLDQVRVHSREGREPFWRRFWRKRNGAASNLDVVPRFSACFFCESQRDIENRLEDAFLSVLSIAELRDRFGQATGLCLPHFARVYRRTGQDAQRVALLESQSGCLKRNLAEIEELVRKHDYRFLDDPRGPEMTAWRRGAEILVGNRGVR